MSEQTLIGAAKGPIITYNEKNWDAVTRAITAGLAYDEVATHRNLRGAVDVISAWKGWAAAFPDSNATFEAAHVSGNTVIPGPSWCFFYSFDCDEPIHIHVRRDRQHGRFWLAPVELAWDHGSSPRELNEIRHMVLEYEQIIIEAWNEHCHQR